MIVGAADLSKNPTRASSVELVTNKVWSCTANVHFDCRLLVAMVVLCDEKFFRLHGSC